MKTRQGFSLVEALIAISLMAVVFTTIAVAMSGMRRGSRQVRQQSRVEADLGRFSAQLRADAHQALSVELEEPATADDEADTLLLKLADERSVQYTIQADRIERVLQEEDRPPHRETYRLPPSFAAQWQVDADRRWPMVSLQLEPGPVDGRSAGPFGFQTMRVDAVAGLLHTSLAPTKE